MADYFEGHRVGAWIRAHREAMDVTFLDLLAQAGPGTDQVMRFVERAQRPSPELIERHHAALMAAYSPGPGAAYLPLARREQWYATGADRDLWHRAQDINPRVSWWWGVRSEAAPRGAWCHLCQSMIHGYDVGRGMTARARRGVMTHRLEHITEQAAAAAHTEKGTRQ